MKTILAVPIATMLLVVAGCSEASSNASAGEGDKVLAVVVGGSEVASWTMEELELAVPFAEIEIDGDTQSGPLLLDVLDSAGVTDWQAGEVLGKGEGRSFDVGLDISSEDVDRGWILDVSNRGTLKLAAADLPRQEWVRDVAEIQFP